MFWHLSTIYRKYADNQIKKEANPHSNQDINSICNHIWHYIVGILMMKATKQQLYWFLILWSVNPMIIAGIMVYISKRYNEAFTDVVYFLMGLYTIMWATLMIVFLLRKNKWIKTYTPKTTDQIIDDIWAEHNKEKEIKNERQKM
jgi:surface polysaccharide O-acyltransferase-like enzyme